MPIYEYRCNDCGRQFEVVQRMTDDPVTVCEACGGAVSRVLYAPAIHFKGSGFHNTDYGTKRRPAGADGDGGGGDKAAKGGGDAGASTTSGTSTASDSGGGSKTVGLDKA